MIGHNPYVLTRQWNGARRQICVTLVAAVLAPPQHSDDRRTHRDKECHRSQRERTRPFGG
jgi:hypothetical protein